jgi:hypothetical protein
MAFYAWHLVLFAVYLPSWSIVGYGHKSPAVLVADTFSTKWSHLQGSDPIVLKISYLGILLSELLGQIVDLRLALGLCCFLDLRLHIYTLVSSPRRGSWVNPDYSRSPHLPSTHPSDLQFGAVQLSRPVSINEPQSFVKQAYALGNKASHCRPCLCTCISGTYLDRAGKYMMF